MKHPAVEDDADHRIPRDQPADLLVTVLPIAGNEGAAVVVTRKNGAGEDIQRLEETWIAAVREVQDHAEPIHLAQKRDALLRQRPGIAGSNRVMTLAVMRQAHHAQALLPPPLRVRGLDD